MALAEAASSFWMMASSLATDACADAPCEAMAVTLFAAAENLAQSSLPALVTGVAAAVVDELDELDEQAAMPAPPATRAQASEIRRNIGALRERWSRATAGPAMARS